MQLHELSVEPGDWLGRCTELRAHGATMFDFLTCVDDPGAGLIQVVVHLVDVSARQRWLVRTQVPRSVPVIDSLAALFAGAGWHEREAHEMVGVHFKGNADLRPLLTTGDGSFPLRRTTALPRRVQADWPGAKDPTDRPASGATGRVAARPRSRLVPPGIPAEWGSEGTDHGH